MRCFFARWASDPCRGRLDPCHILPQRILKVEHARANPRYPPFWGKPSPLYGRDLHDLLSDQRNIVPGCRHHHANADAGLIPYEIPASARAFAASLGLEHRL